MDLNFSNEALSYGKAIFYEAGGWIPRTAREIMGDNFYNRVLQTEVKYCVQCLASDDFKDAVNLLSSTKCWDELPTEYINIVAKHFEKMKNLFNRGRIVVTDYELHDLAIRQMDTLVQCRKLEAPFDIYNKDRYLDGSDVYKLVKKGPKSSVILTNRAPFAKTEDELESKQASIEKVEDTDQYRVTIKNEFIGALNRYAICVSTSAPSVHCGMSVIINGAGNKIYVYAVEFNNDINFEKRLERRAGQWTGKVNVMAYGYKKDVMESTLMKATDFLKQRVDPKVSFLVKPEHDFVEQINWFKDLPDDMKDDETPDDLFTFF